MQASILLGPLMFLIFINAFGDNISSPLSQQIGYENTEIFMYRVFSVSSEF